MRTRRFFHRYTERAFLVAVPVLGALFIGGPANAAPRAALQATDFIAPIITSTALNSQAATQRTMPMSSFVLDMSSPFASGGGVFIGGPGEGGHHGKDWFNAFGMDLGAPGGTEIHAVFDGKITKIDNTHIDATSGKEFGAEVFVRAEKKGELTADDPGGVGAFYTHLNSLAPEVVTGAHITRGQVIGLVSAAQPPHLHLALAERRNGKNFGVNLYSFFQQTINTTSATGVTFFQDGKTPPRT